MRPAKHTGIPTVAEVVNRAVDVVDPMQGDPAVAEFQARFEDRDEPVTTLEDPTTTFEEARRMIDLDGSNENITRAAQVAEYLAYRRDEIGEEPERLLELAARAETG